MNSQNKYCLDTHPLVWYVTRQSTLSSSAKTILDGIFLRKVPAYLSAIVLLEMFHLSLKRTDFQFPDFLKRLRQSHIHVVSIDQHILSCCYTLPATLDIHDRIIVATAKITHTTLITRDPVIQKTKAVPWIW